MGHSVLESIHSYNNQWIGLNIRNLAAPPFTAAITELDTNFPRLTRRQNKRLAKIWDDNKDNLTCANTCIDTSTSFRDFNHALADAADVPRALLDEAVKQAAAARTNFALLRGEPAPTGCDAPGECPGPG